MKCQLSFLLRGACLSGGILLTASSAHGYVSMRSTTQGAEVHWPQGATLTYRTNVTNSSGLAAADVFSMFTTGLSRWKQAAQNGFSFAYYQGTDPSVYPNSLNAPYDNTIYFTSNASASDQLACGVIALTEVWFDPSDGQASKAALRFNDKCFTFTTSPGDTISQQKIFLGDVATHELGHSLGLDHSQNAQASMVYTADLEMAHPSCDDQAAMMHLYVPGGAGLSGTLTGHVDSPAGAPVFGAHVQVVELERGVVMASALSDTDGSFRIAGLEPGHYGAVVEPFYPGPGSLGSYYGAMSAAVCAGGTNFNRTFARAGAELSSFAVAAGGATDTGTITVSCSAPVSAAGGAENALATAPVLATGAPTVPVATQSVFTATSSNQYYRLVAQSGPLSVTALSYTLFSPDDIQVELLDATGTRLAGSTSANVFSSATSGYVDYDASASTTVTQPQDVYVHVYSNGAIALNRFPSGALGVSATAYYVLTVSQGASGAAPLYPVNARCEAQDSFQAYSSPGAAPPFQNQTPTPSTGCGTISDGDHDPTNPTGVARLGNFFGMIAFLALARRALRRAHSAVSFGGALKVR